MWSHPVRLATSPGKSNRPTVVITQDWHVWVGNENSEDLALEAMPLFGFGLGEYEDKVVEGTSIQIANFFLAVVKLSHSTLYWLQVPPITLYTCCSSISPIFCNSSFSHTTLEAIVCRMCWNGLFLGKWLMTKHWSATMALLHLCAVFCTKCHQTMVWLMSRSWTTSTAPRWELQFGSNLPIIMLYFVLKSVWPKYLLNNSIIPY